MGWFNVDNEKNLNLEELTEKNLGQINDIEGSSDIISLLALNEILSKKKLKSMSRLKPEQVSNLVKMHVFAKEYGISLVDNIASLIEELQISINGLGRKEVGQLVQRREEVLPVGTKTLTSKDIFR
jgi:hypothetical protein